MTEAPIQTRHLFPILDDHLIHLLKTLTLEDWNRGTLARHWQVKDIAAHLLDGNLRTLSIFRDGYFGDPPTFAPKSYEDIVNYLNRLNGDWVQAMKRLSPRVLIDLLESSGRDYHQCLMNLNDWGPALFPVDWAGEQESKNWFHIAREYTEKWHHQMQIREAVGAPGLMQQEFFRPVIETFMRALPHTYRHQKAELNTCVTVRIASEGGGHWAILFSDDHWHFTNASANAHCSIEMDPDTAWKLFTKGISLEAAEKKTTIVGDRRLADPLLSMVAVMALRA